MRWVDVRDCMPDPEDRVLVAMHVQAVKSVVAVGQFRQDYWTIDECSRPVRLNEVQYWAPIPMIPRDRKSEGKGK